MTQGSHRSTTSTYVNCVCEPFLFMLFKDRLLASNQAFDNIFETINLNYEAISYKYWIFFKTSSIISLVGRKLLMVPDISPMIAVSSFLSNLFMKFFFQWWKNVWVYYWSDMVTSLRLSKSDVCSEDDYSLTKEPDMNFKYGHPQPSHFKNEVQKSIKAIMRWAISFQFN